MGEAAGTVALVNAVTVRAATQEIRARRGLPLSRMTQPSARRRKVQPNTWTGSCRRDILPKGESSFLSSTLLKHHVRRHGVE